MDYYADSIARSISRAKSEWSVSIHAPSADLFNSKLKRYIYRFIKYPNEISKDRADVNHITDSALSHLINSLDSSNTIITCHDVILVKEADGSIPCNNRSRIAALALKYSLEGLKKANKIIVDSEATKRDLLHYGYTGNDKISVIHLGVDPVFQRYSEEDYKKARVKFGIPSGKIILHVGVNYSYKNVEAVLEVLKMLEKDGACLVKVGAGWNKFQSSFISKNGLGNRIIHLGYITKEELSLIYGCVDCLLIPSFYEGFGLPPLEALACGTPVVASNAGALPEVLGDAAILVDPKDVKSIVEMVKRIFSDKFLVNELKAKGFKQVAKFDWKNTASKTLSIYEKIISSRRV